MIENKNENKSESKNEIEDEKKDKKKIILILLLLILLLLLGLFLLNKFFGLGDSLKDGIYERLRDMNGAKVVEVEKKDQEGDEGVFKEDISDIEKTQEGIQEVEDGVTTKDVSEEGLEVEVTIEKTDEQRGVDDDGFSVHQISFGNSVVVGNDDIVGTDLKIESVNVEIVESLDGEGVNAVVTWTTTKNSISELSYSKKNEGDSNTIREKSYGISHAMFIESLEEGEKYVFNIKTRSKNNQEAESGYIGFDAKLEGESFLDSIGDKIKDLFGL